jgi:hypothetical protein
MATAADFSVVFTITTNVLSISLLLSPSSRKHVGLASILDLLSKI